MVESEESAPPPWSRNPEDLLRSLDVDPGVGLSGSEVAARQHRYGRNRLRTTRRTSAWRIFVRQLESVIVGLLVAAAVLAFAFGQSLEAVAILVVVALNSILGFVTELRAIRSVEALRELGRAEAAVRREGAVRSVPAEELVPGDVVLVEAGGVVVADVRVLESSGLQADESVLTGESTPVDKGPEAVASDAPVADRGCMLHKGTAVTRGSGLGVVVSTGMNTEIGRVAELVEAVEDEETPLERRLDVLGRELVWVVLGLAGLVALAGWARGRDLFQLVETAIALGVAAIPEGLPAVATIAMARGVWRMARRNALVRRLSAVETLGSTSVILTDKTGTLTENRMRVERILTPSGDGDDGQARADLLRVSVLCNNGSLTDEGAVGDPTETALLRAGRDAGIERSKLLERLPELREVAFQPETRMMATVHAEGGGGHLVAVKGAPDAVLEACSRIRTSGGVEPMADATRQSWVERAEGLAQEGLRVLAVARKTVEDPGVLPYRDLVFLGLVGLADPPREGIADELAAFRRAGITVVMVTGDHPETARAVAARVGLEPDGGEVGSGGDLVDPDESSESERRRLLGLRIFARASPEQKLNLLGLHQEAGDVVAMTGDGVNDAPALRKADIGVAMGGRGTQVAREAAEVVLEDDEFGTILRAVEEGRAIFQNIRRFVVYLLSCNVSEIAVVALATAAGAPLPILPLQILFLNLVTDVFPALALGVGEAEEGVLRRPPRPRNEPILTRRHWWAVAGYGALITVSVLGSLVVALQVLELEVPRAVSISFLTLAFAQLWHVFDLRGADSRILVNEVTRNPWVWGAVGLCAGLLLLSAYLPVLATTLQVHPPGLRGWAVVAAFGFAPLLAGTAIRALLPVRT